MRPDKHLVSLTITHNTHKVDGAKSIGFRSYHYSRPLALAQRVKIASTDVRVLCSSPCVK